LSPWPDGQAPREDYVAKAVTMQEAISQNVKEGDTLFLSGMQHGEPSAAIHEIVRQGISHLKMVCCLVASAYLLIGEGLVDKVVSAYIYQDVKRYYFLQKAKKNNRLPLFEEYSHFGVCSALLAGQMGLPFMPIKSQIGSDMLRHNPNLKLVDDPYSEGKIGLIKAINPDVGIIHVQRCDAEGNAQKWGTLGVDAEGINASRKVIVTTEKIVDSDIIRRDPNRTIIPGFRVNAVVEEPWGAYPMHMAGCYTSDSAAFSKEIHNPESYEAYVKRLIYGASNRKEYLRERESMKGEGYFERLLIKQIASEPIYTGMRGK
jgi:glutaconate CoA-transferase, subunit A